MDKEYNILEHLESLRKCIFTTLLWWVGCSILAYQFKDRIYEALIFPFGETLIFIKPQEAFVAYFKISLFGGLILAFPFMLFHLWRFISPGLHTQERKKAYMYAPLILSMFLIGTWFSYRVVLPISLEFLMSFQSKALIPMIRVGDYISFAIMLLLSFGILFELPLIIIFLSHIGILNPYELAKKRMIAIVVILFIAALITPPDAFTLLAMGLPLIILFEISIQISKTIYKKSY